MPFKSQSQRRKFYAMAERGEISKAKVKEWEKETGSKKLPEKLGGGAKKLAKAALEAFQKTKKGRKK